ncbi:hypothetical protein PMAYCL1PPCAC_26855, partial [Pristionchus mayeri]
IESLQWKARSAFELIFFHLHTDEDCSDLNNLYKVPKTFYKGIKEYMMRDNNRPGVKQVTLSIKRNGLEVMIRLFPSNLPFYDWAKMNWRGIKRCCDYGPALWLKHLEHPLINGIANLLSSPIEKVIIGQYGRPLSSSELSICAKLL